VYDPRTGKLRLLRYDRSGNGKVDTYSYMDGARTIRMEIDRDGDGKIDQWQYYDQNERIEKLGFSLRHDGIEDAWAYLDPDGSIMRVESSPRRDSRMSRIEHYDHTQLTSAEEDTDGDGHVDKWETYTNGRLATVAFDTAHSGIPDRRILYDAGLGSRVEVSRDGSWVASKPR